ncbi:MAG: Ku protein [Salinicola sp.]|uniref:non-homologous end joining protein Ku n=1 Tax=uncultured Salinicola sp. TaxID=1193542 RepID=UPI000C9879F6|nr:Ku protein [uncultured Salinicola sp.]MAM56153.1 Ku protein [Salinicola sp.]
MSARAVWKGVIGFGEERVPVKLYTAVSDRHVHFRLLDRRRRRPVHQAMIEPRSGKTVSRDDRHKAVVGKQDRILFDTDELDELAPAPSRDIEVMHFLPPGTIDNQWYRRPYYLGPDGDESTFDAFAAALASSGREGLVHWVMRHKAYVGALRDHDGHPVLIILRHLDEVVDADALDPPGGAKLNDREVKMATDLVETYAADFEPATYQDEYRQRLGALVEAKRSGKRLKVKRRRRQESSDDIASSLEASLARERKRA